MRSFTAHTPFDSDAYHDDANPAGAYHASAYPCRRISRWCITLACQLPMTIPPQNWCESGLWLEKFLLRVPKLTIIPPKLLLLHRPETTRKPNQTFQWNWIGFQKANVEFESELKDLSDFWLIDRTAWHDPQQPPKQRQKKVGFVLCAYFHWPPVVDG